MKIIFRFLFMVMSRLAMLMYIIPWVTCRGRRLDECIAAGVIYILAGMTLTRVEEEIGK